MSEATNGSNHLQEPALRYARQDFPIIRDSLNVEEALNVIRHEGVGERIIYFYIINREGQLVGIVPTRRLLISKPDRPIADIMITNVVTISDRASVQRACEMFVEHKLFAFPIVDENQRVRGVIDIGFVSEERISVVERQKIQDIFELIGFGITQLQGRSPLGALQYRLPALLLMFASGVACALLANAYGATLSQNLILVSFLMLVLGVSDSASTQSVALTLENPEFGQPSWTSYWPELRTEVMTTLLLGTVCGVLAAGISWLWHASNLVSLALGGSLLLSVVVAGVIGVTIPILLSRFSKIAAGPVARALTYFTTLLLYLGTARMLLAG